MMNRAGNKRWPRTLAAAVHIALGMALPPWTAAQTASPGAGPLLPPSQVIVQVHEAVADQRFVPLLAGRLRQALAMPVQVGEFHTDLRAFRPTPAWWAPMDATPLLDALIRAHDWRSPQAATRVFIIADDIRLKPANFNFAVSAGGPGTAYHVSVVSLARLQVLERDTIDRAPELTAERTFKLIAKNVARLAGYGASRQCLFGFPSTVSELDALPESFCEPDLSALIAAGIARPAP
jgi:predicted Zn-dependent protease